MTKDGEAVFRTTRAPAGRVLAASSEISDFRWAAEDAQRLPNVRVRSASRPFQSWKTRCARLPTVAGASARSVPPCRLVNWHWLGLKGAVGYGNPASGASGMSKDEQRESFGKPGDVSTTAEGEERSEPRDRSRPGLSGCPEK